MAIKKGDFIQINYTGRLANGEKELFDTTQVDIAKAENVYNPKTKYGPVTIIVGEGHVLPGLDRALEGKDVGTYHFHLADVDAFGKKNAKLMKLIPAKFFKRDNIKPFVGLQVNIDNELGVVRSVNGGRIIVDFNHPLASKDVTYDVEIIKLVTDLKEQVQAFFGVLGVPADDVRVEGKNVTIVMKQLLPEQFIKPFSDDIKRVTAAEQVTFEARGNEVDGAQKK